MQHALIVWSWLHPVDVGALIERPRAIDHRPYEFFAACPCLFVGGRYICTGQLDLLHGNSKHTIADSTGADVSAPYSYEKGNGT